MADTVQIQYIWPPNWDGNPPENGTGGWKKIVVNLKCMSDGTGETNVRKVDISELRCADGSVPTRLAIDKIEGTVNGLDLLIEFDRTPHYEIARLNASTGGAGTFLFDYCDIGGLVDPSDGTDGTGDILFTTTSVASADSYDVVIHARLKS